ncbi:hypothetical protein [Mycobacteroides chelonae]|jgi:hypothetical protein|uniref:hypothetical protein n=1 Tax=Mycobacteroides chelonae TaxID=1774 RepID=UPI0008A94D7F|nr:hypothetical protein [Mycobacteroides chelonae]MBF9326026.1 hypothetical protein [Mycobacteroides chelonae]MBF9420202.1 hypothetical protein [Mycobacteroides chelonae]MBF9438670.1 hypothetical protein [Mycobacteroides chelonae]MBV6359979.1 hypothetical protein [Mycobacteroides chelonae]MEC4834418.1 hypothetical protein [Mycobacteroides chelonae]
MTAAELIEKLRKCPPDALIAIDAGRIGLSATPSVHLANRHVSDHKSPLGPYIGQHDDDGPHEDVVIITHWGILDGAEL